MSPVVLPFISLSSTYGYNETTIPESVDGTSDAIPIPDRIGFPFSNSKQYTVYVSYCTIHFSNYMTY